MGVSILTPIVLTRKLRLRELKEGHRLIKQRKGCWLLGSEYASLRPLYYWDVDFLSDGWGALAHHRSFHINCINI